MQRPARKVDQDSAPKGYDAVIWEMAVYFETKAEEEGLTLAAGRPVLYAVLERRLQSMGWHSTGRIRPVHIDLTYDLIDQFFATEIEHGRAQYAYDQFASKLPDMAAAFIEQVRVARLRNQPARPSETHPLAAERGERVRAERAAQARTEAAIVVDPDGQAAKRDWDEIKARVEDMKAKRGNA